MRPRLSLDQTQLGHYLAGFIEGDGYFGPTKLEIAKAKIKARLTPCEAVVTNVKFMLKAKTPRRSGL